MKIDVAGVKWLKDKVEDFLIKELSKYHFISVAGIKLSGSTPQACLECAYFPECGEPCIYKK